MRTGAIFARGSCRALKWMALFGVVFALGAGSAAAQATFSGVEWTPESDQIKLNMSAAVWSRSPNDAAEDFTVTWGTAPNDMTATGTMSDIPSTRDDAKTSFTVTLDKKIPTGAGGDDGQTGITVAYTIPADSEDVNDRGILDNTAGHAPTDTAATIVVTEAMVDPTLPDVEDQTLRKDVDLTATTAIQLPAAMGNIPFSYLVSDLPSGLTFDVDGADDAEGGTGLNRDRLIIGTPDMAEEKAVRYVVTDRNSRSVSGTFMITVNDVPDAPDAPTVTPTTNTSGSLAVSWTMPEDNNSDILYYEVQHKMTSATDWVVPNTRVLSGTSHMFDGLTNEMSYDFQVRALNGVGMSDWSDTGMGEPMASEAVPAAPAAPTVTATANMQGSLDVMWVEPADNGSAIIDYGLRYRVKNTPNWTVMDEAITGMSTTLSGMPASTTYEVQVSARNDNGSSGWSPSGEGTTAAAPGVPAAPAAPTVTATADTRGSLDVMWEAPADGGSPILDYGVQYKMSSAANWTVMTAAVTGTSTTLSGMPDDTSYDVQVQARNANGMSPWSPTGTGSTAPAPFTRAKRGQLTAFKLVGADVSEKTIGGKKRYHVPEGAQEVELSVTVQWTNDEVFDIGYEQEQWIFVAIQSNRSSTGSSPDGAGHWLSWIDYEGDVHFPRVGRGRPDGGYGRLGGWVMVKTPKESSIAAAERNSERHTSSATGEIAVLVLHDNHEAENDAFFIQAFDQESADVNLRANRGVNAITPEVVIEDDEDQTVTVEGKKTSATVYEGAKGDDVPTFTVTADPERIDLPLEVRLDMVDLGGTTVSSGEISLDKSSMTLTPGNGNSDTVTVHLPANDRNRKDDDYELRTSVNVYSLGSGGYRLVPAESHAIKVLDVHKLPTLKVVAEDDEVEEGGEVELTVTINRNPANTIAAGSETRQYTEEAVDVMLTAGAGTTASTADFQLPMTISFDEHNKKAPWTQEMKVMVKALDDNELDDGEMLAIDAMVSGKETERGAEKDSYSGPGDRMPMLTINDATGKLVWAKTQEEVEAAVYAAKNAGMGDDMMFNPGDMIELMGSALFNAAEGVTLSYSAMTSDNNVASASVDSAGMAMVTAMGAGMADITITAHASMPSNVKIADQTDPREASITFPVEVGLETLTLMLTGPEEMHIVEGGVAHANGTMGTATVTVTANRAVTADVTVMLMRDRAMSTASDDDYMAEAITIEAGMMTGSTTVTAVEDSMSEPGEELVLYGMAEGMAGEVTGTVKLYLWDAAVPALPVIAQLLLAALMAVGGYRRYRRR